MMRRSRVDKNQPEIVKYFRKLGFTVFHIHTLKGGYGDIIIGRNLYNCIIEIKDGTLPPSARKLTTDEEKFHREWRGRIEIVESIDDVLRLSKILP